MSRNMGVIFHFQSTKVCPVPIEWFCSNGSNGTIAERRREKEDQKHHIFSTKARVQTQVERLKRSNIITAKQDGNTSNLIQCFKKDNTA